MCASVLLLLFSFVASSRCQDEMDLYSGLEEDALLTVETTPADNSGLSFHTVTRNINKYLPLLLNQSSESTTEPTKTTTQQSKIQRLQLIFDCPEQEKPSNIGPYEVPSQRDLVLQVRKTLINMFHSYQEKTLYFLRDIKKATKSTSQVEKLCSDKASYKRCVKYVSYQCEQLTKQFVSSLEAQRHDVLAFTQGKTCDMAGLKSDPVLLIKTLAMEDVSMDFALPGFLRLLHACSMHCKSLKSEHTATKPIRHMSDQDLVIRHLLTHKSYQQLLENLK